MSTLQIGYTDSLNGFSSTKSMIPSPAQALEHISTRRSRCVDHSSQGTRSEYSEVFLVGQGVIEQAFERLNFELETLALPKPEWDSYISVPPNSTSLDLARRIFIKLRNMEFSPTQITPTADGGIGFVFEQEEKYADLECDNDGELFAVISDGKGEPDIWQFKMNQFERSARKIHNFFES